jgi:ribosomal protein L37AE/L43A
MDSLSCSICIENIVIGNERGDGLWNCNKCHNVWHFRCIKLWSGTNGPSIFVATKWRCPECSEEHAGKFILLHFVSIHSHYTFFLC